jgi:hypothetical protein
LSCGVALPLFAGEVLMAVMVLFCGDDEKHGSMSGPSNSGTNDPKKIHEMGLGDGYYGTADVFEFNSRHTKFPRGFGPPVRGRRQSPDVSRSRSRMTSAANWSPNPAIAAGMPI